MKKVCGNCEHTDGRIYTSNPPKVKCTITEEFHYKDDECNREEVTSQPYISQGWLCPRCSKINAPWISQCSCIGEKMEITCKTCGSVEKGVLSPGYYTTTAAPNYPFTYSISTTNLTNEERENLIQTFKDWSNERAELFKELMRIEKLEEE